MVRKQLQSKLGVDLSDRKAFIKEQVRITFPSPASRQHQQSS